MNEEKIRIKQKEAKAQVDKFNTIKHQNSLSVGFVLNSAELKQE